MSQREIRRCRIGGTLGAILFAICLFIGLATNSSSLLTSSAVMAIISVSYWLKLAANPAPIPKVNKADLAKAAAMQQEQAKAARTQRETVQQERRNAYLAHPTPLQIRQWTFKSHWEDNHYRKHLNAPLYIYSFGQGIGLGYQSMDTKNLAVIQQTDGVCYLKQIGSGAMFRLNSANARSKCTGLPVNTQEINVMFGDPCVLLPGDCLNVTIFSTVPGSGDTYFYIEEQTQE